jgi:hypothetical protein
MLTQSVINHFGSPQAVADVLGISRQAVVQWGEYVPPISALEIDRVSSGALKYDADFYKNWRGRGMRSA